MSGMWLEGAQVSVTARFVDRDQTPTDPANVQVRYRDPAGQVTTYTDPDPSLVNEPETGKWRFDLPAPTPSQGVAVVEFSGTVNGQVAVAEIKPRFDAATIPT